jgi:hypothetical protein
VFDKEFIPLPKHANYDLLSAIYSLLSASPLSWSGEHVKGHQDDHLLLRPLTRLEKLNVAMDTLAKHFWYHMVDPLNNDFLPAAPLHSIYGEGWQVYDFLPAAPLHSIYGEGWQVWNGDTKLTRPTNTLLYTCVQDPQTQFFWRRKHFVPAHVAPLIAWDTTAKAMTRLPQRERQWVTKTASETVVWELP